MLSWLLLVSVALAPTYLVRFSLLGLPANLLMVWLGLVVVYFVAATSWRRRWVYVWRAWQTIPKWLVIATAGWFTAGVVSLFAGGLTTANVGQFVVWFVQPMSLFFVTWFVAKNDALFKTRLAWLLLVLAAVSAVVATLQYFTLWTLPVEWWGNSQEPKRAIGLFSHPNGYALFVVPVLAWLLPWVNELWQSGQNIWQKYAVVGLWLLGVWGIMLSFSRGGYIGLAVTGIIFLFLYYRKYLLWAALVTLILLAIGSGVSANFRYRLLLPFLGEKSTISRFSLWDTAEHMIADKPILGQGITGFHTQWARYNRDSNLEPYNFPHNIILNAWVNFGILGVVSFTGLMLTALYSAWRNRRSVFGVALGLFVIALAIHGLVDIPYFKNDLALIFWIIFGASDWALA